LSLYKLSRRLASSVVFMCPKLDREREFRFHNLWFCQNIFATLFSTASRWFPSKRIWYIRAFYLYITYSVIRRHGYTDSQWPNRPNPALVRSWPNTQTGRTRIRRSLSERIRPGMRECVSATTTTAGVVVVVGRRKVCGGGGQCALGDG